MTQTSDAPAHLGRCPCGAAVCGDGFRDRASYLEFRVTGLCQTCQDRLYFCASTRDACIRYPLRHGAVVAHDTHRDEIAALPFLFTAEEPRLAWESRFITRIGTRLQLPLDPYEALAPMAPALHDHAVRVHESATVHAPSVTMRLARTEIVIVLDRITCRTVTRLPLPSRRRVVVLADAPPWNANYGTSVSSLERAWGADPDHHRSSLRTCALIGWALAHVPDSGATAAPPIHAVLDWQLAESRSR